jgi:hypothetical protein
MAVDGIERFSTKVNNRPHRVKTIVLGVALITRLLPPRLVPKEISIAPVPSCLFATANY